MLLTGSLCRFLVAGNTSRSTLRLAPSILLLSAFLPASSSFSSYSMSFITERSDGTITVTPKNEADQSALVVITHGLGDSAEGFADVAEVRRDEKGIYGQRLSKWI